jgi:phosphoenolpyruvate synthase/pyruvate phosphate dikinase
MDFIKAFGQIDKDDAASAGGKGASLGEMTRAGIPVPPGFVILSNAFERFLDETNLNTEIDTVLHSVDQREMHTVENASEKIQALILGAKMPEDIALSVQDFYTKLDAQYVAVRSSATAEDSASAAWAGQLDSFLNTTEETLLANVQKCWASLFTPRAIFYRYEKELHKTKISVAVVVQKMVQSEVSGIAFSVHPVTEDYNQLIIEAGFGLGEAIVSGSVTPDSYVVEKSPRSIIDKNVTYQSRALWRAENGGNEWRELSEVEGTKPALSDEQALELSEIILRIESHYGFPCDIEWAYEAGQFFITQSRPITTLTPKADVADDVLKPIVLEKMFSREKSLMYMMMWAISERIGYGDFINYKIRHSFFSFDPTVNKTSVWYSPEESTRIQELLFKKVVEDRAFITNIIERLDANWRKIYPYLSGKETLKTVSEFAEYYEGITQWWSAMNTVYPLINNPDVDKDAGKTFLDYREKSEQFTGQMDTLIVAFWSEALPGQQHFVPFLLVDEAIALANKKLLANKLKEISERAKGYTIYAEVVLTNPLETVLVSNNLSLKEGGGNRSEEIKGTTAFPGIVRGRVQRIINKKDIAKFKEGYVLVAETTFPDHVLAMKKATAIVTDEGGITCHAAIVSRELHKPCVIGTKFATQILHDGDLVEVDADNGVVRILERVGGEIVKKNLTEDKTGNQSDFAWALEYINNHSFDIKEARASLFMSDVVFTQYAEKNCFGHSYSPVFIPCTKKSLKQVIAEEVMNNLERSIWDVFINTPGKFVPALKEANGIQTEIGQLALTPEELKKLKTEELSTYFSSLMELAILWWRYGSIGEEKGLVVEEKILPLLEKNHGFSKDEAREYVMTMTTPSEQSIFSKERVAFLNLCIERGSNMEKIKQYAEKYFYARSDFYSATVLNVVSVSQLIVEQCNKTTAPKLKEELSHISENLKDLLEKKKVLSKKVKLTKEEETYLSYFSSLQEWLDARKLSMQKHFTYIFYFLMELSERTGIAFDTLSLMTVAEIKRIVKGEEVDLKEIQSRDSLLLMVYKEGGEHLRFTGDEAEKLMEVISGSGKKINSNNIRGTVASKGKGNKIINGIVRVVIDPSKDEFNEGEILVTSMTRPEFVPIMKSALAIITDEGGIACHAAIVSRELGIPCVIGTKFATQILHDGDLVEVDADNGVVRILERVGGEIVKKNLTESAVEIIKNTKWHSDWSGPFSLFGLSLPTNTYFEGMEKYFGRSLDHVFVVFKNGIAFSRLPEDQYHELGNHLIEKAKDAAFVKEWATQFKKKADRIKKEIFITAEEFIRKLPELLPYYQAYGAYSAATKIVFDVGYEKLSKETKDILEEARKYSETFYKDDALTIEKALRFLSEKTGYAYEEIFMLTYDELNTYLDEGVLPSHDTLKERWTASGVYFTKDKTIILSSEELARIEDARLENANRTEIKGQIAYKGKVQGRCRIVLDYSNAFFEEGNILVTGMTDPQFVSLMKKASAIITDGGGMLSHAAIVARELKTPCIIGTKIATQILKDGDFVEVDADNGVVRILQPTREVVGKADYAFMWSTGPNTVVQWASAISVRDRRDIIPIDISMMSYFDGDTVSTYVPASDLKNIREQISPRFLNPKNFESYRHGYEKERSGWWKWVREIETRDFSKTAKDELLQVYEQFTQNIYDAIANFWMSRPEVTFAVEQRLEEILKEHRDDSYLDDVGTLLTSIQPDDIQMQQIALEKISEENDSDKELIQHLSEFPWLVFGQFNEPEAISFLRERIDEIQRGSKTISKDELRRGKESLRKKQLAILQVLPLEQRKETEYLSGYLQFMSHERMEIKAYWAGCFWLCRKLLKRIAELAKMPIAEMLGYLSPLEVRAFLLGELSDDRLQEKINLRRKQYLIIRSKGGILRMVDGDEAVKLFKESMHLASIEIREVRGQTASRGLYTGKIRKVKVGDLADLQASIREFKKGEILVTSMTQPNMMVLANRAGAIVTDEGGIASHAAIISRELKIPCVVGCSNAMQVFQNGDLVEVDADRSIVKKLSE